MTSNAQDTLDELTAARMGWMTGQPSDTELPELAELPPKEAQMRLLAMDAQLRAIATVPNNIPTLTFAQPMPKTDRAFPQEAARPLFRRLWESKQQETRIDILDLLDRRGYIAHPFDFAPETAWDQLPEIYGDVLAWSRHTLNAAQNTTPAPCASYSRQRTQLHYADLRRQNHTEATEWLQSELAQNNAQNRLRLLRDIANQMTLADEPLLNTLVRHDRSGKVMAFAIQILRRLGARTPPPDDLSALEYLERFDPKAPNDTARIGTPKKMNQTRASLLATTLGEIGFQDLAKELGLPPAELIKTWDWDHAHHMVSDALQRCIFSTGQEEDCLALIAQFANAPTALDILIQDDMARLSKPARQQAISMLIENTDGSLHEFWFLLEYLNNWRLNNLSEAQSAALWDCAKQHSDLDPSNAAQQQRRDYHEALVFRLSMCLHPAHAQLALDFFASQGLHSADPVLAPLHLNVALPFMVQEGY